MNRFLIGGAIAALAAITPATAQVLPPPGVAQGTMAAPAPIQRQQTRVMVMSNETMTRDQVAAHVRKFFERLDANHDGYLTRNEMGAMGQHAMMMRNGKMMHEEMGMGKMPMGEMPMGGMEMRDHQMSMPDRAAAFDRLDANHDGNISRREFMAAKPRREEKRVIVMRDGGAPGVQPSMPGMDRMEHMERMKVEMHGMQGMRMGFGGRLFGMADANHDERVSLAEAQAAALAHFDKADINHDGKITPDERRQAQMMMREHRPS
jgi:Ca2+-binding EF-hand superfamily protein